MNGHAIEHDKAAEQNNTRQQTHSPIPAKQTKSHEQAQQMPVHHHGTTSNSNTNNSQATPTQPSQSIPPHLTSNKYSWASDDDLNFQFNQPTPSPARVQLDQEDQHDDVAETKNINNQQQQHQEEQREEE